MSASSLRVYNNEICIKVVNNVIYPPGPGILPDNDPSYVQAIISLSNNIKNPERLRAAGLILSH